MEMKLVRLLGALAAGAACAAHAATVTLPVAEVAQAPDPQTKTFPAKVLPVQRVDVTPEVSGDIIEVCFKDGALVKANDVLYKLLPIKYKSALKNAEARVAECKARKAFADAAYERHTKLAAGAVSSAKLADGAVTGAKLADGAVTAEKLSAGALSGKADLVGGKVKPSQLSRSKSSVSASRTLALSDEGKALYCTNSSAVTLTIPDNASAAFPLGTEILIYRKGSGTVTVAAASGVTLLCPGQKLLASRYGSARLKKWDTNTWSLEGEGLAPAGYLNNFASGFAPAGAIRLTQGVHYAASQAQLPTPGTAGRVFLVAAD